MSDVVPVRDGVEETAQANALQDEFGIFARSATESAVRTMLSNI